MTRLVLLGGIAVLLGCGKSDDKSSGANSTPPTGSAAAAAPGVPAASGKLSCDEDRYQKWLAMKKEVNAALASGLEATGKKVEAAGKDSAVGKGEAVSGLVATGKDIQAVEAKYGFEHREAREWNGLSSTVMNMRPLDSPMMKGLVETYRKAQASGGPEKDHADKFFAEQEQQGKKAEAKARDRFGDACVDLMLKHSAEVIEVEMTGAAAVLGGMKRK